MLVWQQGESGLATQRETATVAARESTRAPAWLIRSAWTAAYLGRPVGRQLSREARVALQYAVAIGSAVVSSWLLLRLGL